jgi:alpha-1,6-mannosyltransferase
MIAGGRLFLAVPGLALLFLNFVALRLQRGDDLSGFIACVLAQGAIYFVAVYWVASRRASPLWLILMLSVLLRLPLLASPPYLSKDVYRYVWDGRVQAAGMNPYRYLPAASELRVLRDERIYPNIDRRTYALTIYPPAAQLFFLATTRISESVTWMKASMLAWEGLAIALLLLTLRRAGQPEALVLLYAWHPLALWEFASSGHIDAAAIACCLGALLARVRHRNALAGVALGIGTLFKLYPVALLPAFWRPGDRRMPLALAATMAVGYSPYLGAGPRVLGFLPDYLHEEGLLSSSREGSRYYLLQLAETLGADVGSAAYLVPAGLALATLSVWICLLRKPRHDFAGGALLLASAEVLAFSPHYAWYFAWLMPLAAMTTAVPVLLLGVQSFLLYFENPFSRAWIGTLMYVPFVTFLVFRARTVSRSAEVARAGPEASNANRSEP